MAIVVTPAPSRHTPPTLAVHLDALHFDGTGCGDPTSPNACSNCYGPSPMTARQVSQAVGAWLGLHWQTFRQHHPVGAYLPTGQMDGDCKSCHTPWPCPPVLALFDAKEKR